MAMSVFRIRVGPFEAIVGQYAIFNQMIQRGGENKRCSSFAQKVFPRNQAT